MCNSHYPPSRALGRFLFFFGVEAPSFHEHWWHTVHGTWRTNKSGNMESCKVTFHMLPSQLVTNTKKSSRRSKSTPGEVSGGAATNVKHNRATSELFFFVYLAAALAMAYTDVAIYLNPHG